MRPDYCPIGGEPCQSVCADPCTVTPKPHDGKHPYVRIMKGCGHGVLFTDYCRDCEIVSVQEQYRNAIRTVQRCRNELRRLGVKVPGQTSLAKEST
jgi:radical SAM superfamily enzyme YgiQ (UPF0313 family)